MIGDGGHQTFLNRPHFPLHSPQWYLPFIYRHQKPKPFPLSGCVCAFYPPFGSVGSGSVHLLKCLLLVSENLHVHGKNKMNIKYSSFSAINLSWLI